MHRPRSVRPLLVAALAFTFLASGAWADFAPITDEERALTAVPGEPNAPAVVLFKKGEFLMMGFGFQTGSPSSYLRIQVRKKILTEEGKSNGEVTISHSDFERLQGFKGRTVLPDGTVIPVSGDAKFVRKTSRSRKTFTTAVAFPSVQVGAILDYQYEVRFDSIYFLDPWYFSEDIPVRYSEVTFKTAPDIQLQAWSRAPARVQIQRTTDKTSNGFITKVWAENLPSVPDDPYGPPYTDMAAQMLMLPSAISNEYMREPLLESWPKVCEMIGKYYDQVRRRDGGLAKTARELAGSGPQRQQAEALYRFVRDQIETEPFIGVVIDPEESLAKMLSNHKADHAEKALLLQAMLKAVKIDSRLVWAGDRDRGTIDPALPNPNWFDTMFVLLDLDGQRTFLDPTDRALGFGQLRADYEGTPALIVDAKKPEGIVIPEAAFDKNLQRAEIDLALDEKGRLAGTGTLRLTGHHAWQRIDWQEDEAKTVAAWKDWLADRFRDYQISDVKAVESADEGKVTLTWAMAQREDEVLGDEASLVPAAPLGPIANPFVQAAASRRTGVLLDFPDREEVELRLRWPEKWALEAAPQAKNLVNAAGTLTAEIERDDAGRTLVYRRRVDTPKRVFSSSQEYEALRSFYAEREKTDAQSLLLARR